MQQEVLITEFAVQAGLLYNFIRPMALSSGPNLRALGFFGIMPSYPNIIARPRH